MANVRVIASFMHENEKIAAEQVLTSPIKTDSYVMGEIDEAAIPDLRREGLVVQVLEERPPAVTGAAVHAALAAEPRFLAEGMPAAAVAAEAAIAPPALDETKPDFYLIDLAGPLVEEWRSKLDDLQVVLLERIPPTSYTARLAAGQARAVQALAFVQGIRLYGPQDTGPIDLPAAAPPTVVAPDFTPTREMRLFDVRLHRAEDRPEVEAWLSGHDVPIAGMGTTKIRIYAFLDSGITGELSALPAVSLVEPYVEPGLCNDVARDLLGVDTIRSSASAPIGLDGDGELVAIADTGIDDSHPDFAGRVAGIKALGRQGCATDPHGHGTHVAGSVLGDGTASQGKLCGIAPKARLYFQSLLDSRGGLGGLPVDLGELFEDAYQAGARIHNDSWGAATEAVYTLNSEDVDRFVAEHRDMLIVIAAGNEGNAADPRNAPPGYPDWLSVGSPATSKNALTVGASRSSRTDGAYSGMAWGEAWPGSFPAPPVSAEKISGDPDSLAEFSSRGPCDDYRVKPDVVAPGTDIASTKSALAPLVNFWGPYPGYAGHYAYMGGTSMATPLVCGCAALVRGYYVKARNWQPSAALLKATLINGTRWLSGGDALAGAPAAPNYNQGFGAVYLPGTIPNSADPRLALEFVDTWRDPARHFGVAGQCSRYALTVNGGTRLRFCLAYTDPPARSLQNDLNLLVEDPSGTKLTGNAHLPVHLTELDRCNNVEVVAVDAPQSGRYLVQVSAFNLLSKGQDFALVVTGDLGSPLQEV